MVKGDEFWKLYLDTQESCDNQCDKCVMYIKYKNRCLHESLKAWEEWNKKEKLKEGRAWNEQG